MGTIKSSESMELAEYLRTQRTMSEDEVSAAREQHDRPARYDGARDWSSPAAH